MDDHVRFIKELYLSIFVLAFRLGAGQWPKEFNADAHKGVVVVALVQQMLGLAIVWSVPAIDVFSSKLAVGAFYFILLFINYYVLIVRGSGVKFEKEFDHFPKWKRIALLSEAAIAILASFAIAVVVAKAHRA